MPSATPKTLPFSDDSAVQRPTDLFKGRESAELVVGFSGPLGSGIESAVAAASDVLAQAGYEVQAVKLSDYIEASLRSARVQAAQSSELGSAAERYNRLQDGGNALRTKYGDEVLAEYAVTRIAMIRETHADGKVRSNGAANSVPTKRAYLVDQLKHPAEVSLLRTVYRNLFFLIGVLSVSERRGQRLSDLRMSREEVAKLMERDRSEDDSHGQQLDKTLELADFFIRNDKPNADAVKGQMTRFVDLMHGSNGVSPTREEYGMYVAFASSLGSACLSRQVGAAILDAAGVVIGTGCNDVPRYGGGLYGAESGSDDARCVKREGQRCWNDHYKKIVREDVRNALDAAGLAAQEAEQVAKEVYSTSRIKDLIEFSRAVHAEMEAVISVARRGVGGLVGGTLYTTTFPCHSCARHIVAAGLDRVVFIEPYERSLAADLHGDSISLDPENSGQRKRRVDFVHFEGVAPRRYIQMFRPAGPRKVNGVAIAHPLAGRRKIAPEYLDDYREFELKVVKHLNEIGAGPDELDAS